MSSRSQILAKVREDFLEPLRKEQGIHAGLWLDKYIGNQSKVEKDTRSSFVKEVSVLPVSKVYEAYFASYEKMLKEYKADTRKAEVQGRMVVGLGSESVLETSIALHRTYGVPYIPGSALKGLAASYAQQHLDDDWQPEKENGAFKIVFGDTAEAGYITFFDALYVPNTGYKGQALYPDVITVHHQDYYNGKGSPTDMDSPNPVPFLSATGTYLVALAAPEIVDSKERKAWINATFAILQNAMKTMGVGAKTSSGYGRLELESGPVEVLYVRPNIPKFQAEQPILSQDTTVIVPTDELRRIAPSAKAYLRFREFPTKVVFIAVEAEEATSWRPGDTKSCQFLSEAEFEGYTVLFCKPRMSKHKNKK